MLLHDAAMPHSTHGPVLCVWSECVFVSTRQWRRKRRAQPHLQCNARLGTAQCLLQTCAGYYYWSLVLFTNLYYFFAPHSDEFSSFFVQIDFLALILNAL